MALEDRFKSVEARCSGFAQELLRQVQHDAQLAELLAELEKIDGIVFRSDIEAALPTLRKNSEGA